MMTEKEAKTKWCPMARIDNNHNTAAYNRLDTGERSSSALCLGAGCACWIWVNCSTTITSNNDGKFLSAVTPNMEYPIGFCGLTRR